MARWQDRPAPRHIADIPYFKRVLPKGEEPPVGRNGQPLGSLPPLLWHPRNRIPEYFTGRQAQPFHLPPPIRISDQDVARADDPAFLPPVRIVNDRLSCQGN